MYWHTENIHALLKKSKNFLKYFQHIYYASSLRIYNYHFLNYVNKKKRLTFPLNFTLFNLVQQYCIVSYCYSECGLYFIKDTLTNAENEVAILYILNFLISWHGDSNCYFVLFMLNSDRNVITIGSVSILSSLNPNVIWEK